MLYRLSLKKYVDPDASDSKHKKKHKQKQKQKQQKKRKTSSSSTTSATKSSKNEDKTLQLGTNSSTTSSFENQLEDLERAHDERLYNHGLGDSALGGLPRWMIRYASLCLRYVEHENRELPSLLRRAVFLRKQQLAESAIRAGASKEKAMRAAAKAAATNVRSGSHSEAAGEQLKKEFAKSSNGVDNEERKFSIVGRRVKIFWPLDRVSGVHVHCCVNCFLSRINHQSSIILF